MGMLLLALRVTSYSTMSYQSVKKCGIWIVISRKPEPIFWMQDFVFGLLRVKRSDKSCKPLINGHGFKLKYFLFTYFHSMLIESTSVKWEVRVWNLGQIFKTQLNHCAVILCSTLSLQSIFSLHSFFAQTLEHVIRPQKNEKWGLEIQDRSSRSDYRWLVSNTVPLSLPKIYKLFEPFWLLN